LEKETRKETREKKKMPMSATMLGALLGLGTQMYSNALRKLPYMRHPWEHVLGIGLGVLFTTQLVKWDAKLQVDLDIMLAKAKAANESRYFGQLLSPFQFSCKKMMTEAFLVQRVRAKAVQS
ncbi:hypothetical protein IFM89_004475, partial [Coptis chinensis]